jgi:hypothetical protein
MLNDWLDRIQDLISDADVNDWIAAIIIGLVVQFLVLLLFRFLGFFVRMATWFIASLIGVGVALFILDRQGVPRSIGGRQIDQWIDDIRGFIGA